MAELPSRPDREAEAELPAYPAAAEADDAADTAADRRPERSGKSAALRKTFAPASLPGLLALVLSLAGNAGI